MIPVAVMLAVVTVCVRASTARLPPDVIGEVIARAPDMETLLSCDQASSTLHSLAQPLLAARRQFRHRLQEAGRHGSDADLPGCVSDIIATVLRCPNPQSFAGVVRPQDAIGLYDRLVRSELPSDQIIDLLTSLIEIVHVFAEIVNLKDFSPEQVVALLPALPPVPENIDDVPAPLLEIIQILAEGQNQFPIDGLTPDLIAQVRKRYPPPFDLIYPYNDHIAQKIIRIIWQDKKLYLALDTVVRALLRYGLRFEMDDYVGSVAAPVPILTRIWPLLRTPPNLQSELFKILSNLILIGAKDRTEVFVQMPDFIEAMRANRPEFVEILLRAVDFDRKGIIRLVIQQPFYSEVRNVRAAVTQRTLLEHAMAGGDRDLIMLVQRASRESRQVPVVPSPSAAPLLFRTLTSLLCFVNHD